MSDIDWKKIGQTVAGAAPVIGGLLTGPYGVAVTAAGALVSAVLGVDNSPAAVEQALKADPEALVKLKQAQMDHKLDLEKIILQREQVAFSNTQGARDRDIEVRKTSDNKDNSRANWMIIGDIIGMLACLAAMIYLTWLGVTGGSTGEVSPIVMAANGPLGMLTQQFANGLRDAHNFEFGSSRGSKEKDDALAMMGK